jgi:peptidoglycan/LPS O-acetylase OafA/YrhL
VPEIAKMPRNLNLDVLRGLAVLIVMLGHYPIHWRLDAIAWTGVDLFFVISGFLVSGLLFKEFTRTGDVRLGRFWLRRAARIYPPFLALIGGTVALAAILEPGFVRPSAVLAELTWTQNFWPGVWTQTWSLAVEEHFYVLLPLAMIPMLGRLHRWPRVVAGACAMSILARITCVVAGIELSPGGQPATWFTLLRLDNLALGTLLAYGWYCRRDLVDRLSRHRVALWAVAIGGTAPLLMHWSWRTEYVRTAGLSVLGVSFAAAVLLALTAAPWRFAAPVAWVGRISYSLYLWHFAVSRWLPLPKGSIEGAVAYLAGSILVGWLMARAVEDPAIRIRDKIFPGRKVTAVAANAG